MKNILAEFFNDIDRQAGQIQRVGGFSVSQMKVLLCAIQEKARSTEADILSVYDFVYCKLSKGLSFEKMISCLTEKEPTTFATKEKPTVISAKEKRVREVIVVELRKAAEQILIEEDASVEYSYETNQVQLGDAIETNVKITRRPV